MSLSRPTIKPASVFVPTVEAETDVLEALIDPEQSLGEIAERFHVTLEALIQWIDRPEIAARIDTIERVNRRRARLLAATQLRNSIDVLRFTIVGHLDNETHCLINPRDNKALAQRDRARETARLAASQIIRLAGPTGPAGPCGTGVGGPPVHSAQRPSEHQPPPKRTHRAAQVNHLSHKDQQAITPLRAPEQPPRQLSQRAESRAVQGPKPPVTRFALEGAFRNNTIADPSHAAAFSVMLADPRMCTGAANKASVGGRSERNEQPRAG